jgi:hypothetical protein
MQPIHLRSNGITLFPSLDKNLKSQVYYVGFGFDLFSVFFRAPDGHLIDYVDMLNEETKALLLGIVMSMNIYSIKI